MPTTRIPTYDSIAEACKTGCFCCGAQLDVGKVKMQMVPMKRNTRYVVMCSACGDPTMFAVRPSDSTMGQIHT
jgi:hypothetical protein